MNHEEIKRKVLDVLIDYKVLSYPIDCIAVLAHYGFKCIPYSEMPEELKILSQMCSDDAFKFKDKICYDDSRPIERIRFSLMHELGHYILDHKGNDTKNEYDANYFSNYILVPRLLIKHSHCRIVDEVALVFNVSRTVARIAYNDYLKWVTETEKNGESLLDRDFYCHFYDRQYNRLVYKQRQCYRCGKFHSDMKKKLCIECRISDFRYSVEHSSRSYDPNEEALDRLRGAWLYGGI